MWRHITKRSCDHRSKKKDRRQLSEPRYLPIVISDQIGKAAIEMLMIRSMHRQNRGRLHLCQTIPQTDKSGSS